MSITSQIFFLLFKKYILTVEGLWWDKNLLNDSKIDLFLNTRHM